MKVAAKVTTNNVKFADLEVGSKKEQNNIEIFLDQKCQIHKGFGGALTEATAYIYSLLNADQKKEFVEAIFGENGLNYNMARLTIGSCDFSLGQYDYIENGDLSTFSLEHEKQYLFPIILDVLKYKNIEFMASSWSPLGYMKDNNDKCHGGHLKEEYYDEYANYLVTYVKMMRDLKINITSMTIQNEPEAVQVWESCIFDEKSEAKLAKNIKHELLENNLGDVKLFIWDHNRDVIVRRVKESLKYLGDDEFDGIAYHWYDNWAFSQLSEIHQLLPNKELIFTEGCVELLIDGNKNGAFANGMRYAKNYILDCLNYSNGFFDWNMLLNSKGGPNHVGNFCEAPIMFDIENKQLIYNYSYYTIKHFSNFIKPSAIRFKTSKIDGIDVIAYHNPDNSLVVVIVNDSKDTQISIQIDNEYISCYSMKDSVISISIGM